MQDRTNTTDHINAMLEKNYASRVALAGAYWGRKSTTLWYCHGCKNWFHQNYQSIYRASTTRCACKAKTGKGKKGYAAGEYKKILPEWECWDREPPADLR